MTYVSLGIFYDFLGIKSSLLLSKSHCPIKPGS